MEILLVFSSEISKLCMSCAILWCHRVAECMLECWPCHCWLCHGLEFSPPLWAHFLPLYSGGDASSSQQARWYGWVLAKRLTSCWHLKNTSVSASVSSYIEWILLYSIWLPSLLLITFVMVSGEWFEDFWLSSIVSLRLLSPSPPSSRPSEHVRLFTCYF